MSSKLTSTAGSKKISKFVSSSSEETEAIAREIGRALKGNEVLCLSGDLGAGKTTFCKGLVAEVAALSPHVVNSPTFTYLNIYEGKRTLYHFDCYRLQGANDFLERGFDEYLGELCIIEWPEIIAEALPEKRHNITFSYVGEKQRVIIYERG